METWTKRYEKASPDKESLKLLEDFKGKLGQIGGCTIQSGNEVAEIVKAIILSKTSSLRHPTNDKFSLEQLKAKLVDISGDHLVDLLNKNYLITE